MRVRLGDVCDRGTSNLKQSDITDTSGEYPVYGASGLIGTVSFYHQKLPYVAVVKDGAGIGRTTLHPAESSVIGTMQYLLPKANILPEYLYYVVKHMHLEKYYTGATIPHIYFKDYKSEEFNLEPLEKQHIIVDMLEKIESVIEARQKELKRLDDLIKSRFVEMFGDADSFEKAPLDYSVEEMFIGPFGSSLKNECFIAADQGYCMVYEQKHAIRKSMDVDTRYVDKEKYKELSRFTVQSGDIIVSCRGTIGETFIIPEGAPFGIMHPSIMKIRLKASAYNRVFFNQLLQTVLERHQADSNGSGVKMAITATALGKECFIRPPMELQKQFAAFVEQTDKSKLLEWINLAKKSFDLLHERICNGRHFI